MEEIDKDSLQLIFHFTYAPFLLAFKRVCKRWNQILSKEYLLPRLTTYFEQERPFHNYCSYNKPFPRIILRVVGHQIMLFFNVAQEHSLNALEHHPGMWLRTKDVVHSKLKLTDPIVFEPQKDFSFSLKLILDIQGYLYLFVDPGIPTMTFYYATNMVFTSPLCQNPYFINDMKCCNLSEIDVWTSFITQGKCLHLRTRKLLDRLERTITNN